MFKNKNITYFLKRINYGIDLYKIKNLTIALTISSDQIYARDCKGEVPAKSWFQCIQYYKYLLTGGQGERCLGGEHWQLFNANTPY